MDFIPGGEKNPSSEKQLALKKQEKIQFLDYEITFLGFDVSGMMSQEEGQDVSVGANLLVSYKGEHPTAVKPIISKGKEGWAASPVRLPGPVEAYLTLVQIQASEGRIVLDYQGPAASPEKGVDKTPPAFIAEISTKPGMTVLWLGTFLILLGGSFGVVRRWPN